MAPLVALLLHLFKKNSFLANMNFSNSLRLLTFKHLKATSTFSHFINFKRKTIYIEHEKNMTRLFSPTLSLDIDLQQVVTLYVTLETVDILKN